MATSRRLQMRRLRIFTQMHRASHCLDGINFIRAAARYSAAYILFLPFGIGLQTKVSEKEAEAGGL